MCAMLLSMIVVIYCRYSSDLQSSKSCKDQEREVRESLTRMGIDHSNAIVIYDEAESGTKVFRDEFVRLQKMVDAGPVTIVVDDQARLSRADNTFGFVTDLVYGGGRFISTGEGIDTEQTGWELRVKVMELHNSTTIRELGRRVRRGQLGRILAGLSAGDFCYGFESYIVNPDFVYERRGPKPERGLRINETEAKWVRKIFAWFVAERSIGWITRELNRLNVPTGTRRTTKRWRETHVRKMLANEKYCGIWLWGATRTVRNSQGKTKQVPVPEDQHIVVERLELRIVDEVTWEKAVARLAELKELYGSKTGQKRRGPKVHHTELYPGGLLAGLVFCSKCGSRLWQKASGPRQYLLCPNRGESKVCCEMTTAVPLKVAESKVLNLLQTILNGAPDWVAKVIEEMKEHLKMVAETVPAKLKQDRKSSRQLESKINNFVAALGQGFDSDNVKLGLIKAEKQAETLRKEIAGAEKLLAKPVSFPSSTWIEKQLEGLAGIIREGEFESFTLLRKLVGRIEADQVISPGKSRGFSRLRFKLDGGSLLKVVFEKSEIRQQVESMLSTLTLDDDEMCFALDLGELTPMDRWAPEIVKMRSEGVKWTEIVALTGLDLNRAYLAWKRYVEATDQSNEESGTEVAATDHDQNLEDDIA